MLKLERLIFQSRVQDEVPPRLSLRKLLFLFATILGVSFGIFSEINLFSNPIPETKPKVLEFYQPYISFSDTQFEKLDLLAFERMAKIKVPLTLRENFIAYYPIALKYSQVHGVDPFWVLAIMWTESHFIEDAVSRVGARGLMQLMPKTAVYLKQKIRKAYYGPIPKNELSKYSDPQTNINLSIFYLKRLATRFNDLSLATISYNVGPTRLRRKLKLLKNEPGRIQKMTNRNAYLTKVKRRYEFLVSAYQEMSPKYEPRQSQYPRIAQAAIR